MRFIYLFTLLLFPVVAHAQSDDAVAELCGHVKAKKSIDGVEYVPGTDVYGNPVVPADLPPSIPTGGLYYPIPLPIDLNIAERYGLNLPKGIEIEPNIANLILLDGGRVVYANKDITASIESICENPKAELKKNQSNQAEQHGHESANPVLSTDKIEGQYPED